MSVPRKPLALLFSALIAVSAAMISQSRAQDPAAARSGGDTLVVEDATVDWIDRSEVAALIEGTVDSIELEVGETVKKNGILGYLHRKKAELTVTKAKLGANNTAAIEKAVAQKDQAGSVVARNDRIEKRNPGIVPKEDIEKAYADFNVSKAMIREAQEAQALAKAELALAENQLEEHTIRSPFAGVVIKRNKGPNESVAARESVVEVGNLDRLRVFAYIPIENLYKVAKGTAVEFELKIPGLRGGLSPAEQKKFRGVISFVDPQVQPTANTGVRIYADFANESHELMPGLKGTLTILLNTTNPNPTPRGGQAAAPAPSPAASPAEPVVQTGGVDLPPLPLPR